MEGACALGLGAAAPQAMVGAKAAGHHGVLETNPRFETSSKKLSSAARRSTVQFYVRRRKKKGRFRTRVKLVRSIYAKDGG